MFKTSGPPRVKTLGFIIAMAVAALVAALYMAGPEFLEVLEAKTLDLRFRLRGVRSPGDHVAIVAIDDKSIAALGRWPWSRSKMAELLLKLREDGAKVVAYDVIFSEKEAGLSASQIEAFSGAVKDDEEASRFIAGSLSGDYAFRDALNQVGQNAVLPLVLKVPVTGQDRTLAGEVPSFVESKNIMVLKGDEAAYEYIVANAADAPLEEFSENTSLGHIYAYLDRDGAMRWDALAIKYGDGYYPSLGLTAARVYLGIPPEGMSLDFGEDIKLGNVVVPTDEHGRMLINYCGPAGTFKYYSFIDVLEGRCPEGAFKDKVVLVGANALGIYDLRVTPFSANTPGVEKHANVIENILSGNFMHRRESYKPLTLLGIFVIALALGIAIPRLGPFSGAGLAFVLVGACWLGCYYALVTEGVWLDLFTPMLTIIMVHLAVTSYRFLAESHKARSIKKIFSSYLTPKMVDQLSKNPDLAKLGGERKEMTVMFSDVRGFTTFSENHEPEEVVARLNEYMGEMTHIIFEFDGTVDKFVGDAIMAFWGAPLPQEDQAERAIECSVQMVRRLRELQAKWAAEGKFVLDMGVGINSGGMVVGNMGAEGKKMDYTVIGDSVNLGARVEGLTKNYDTHIIITEFTYDKIMARAAGGNGMKENVSFRKLDSVKVKGKERPVTIYSVDA